MSNYVRMLNTKSPEILTEDEGLVLFIKIQQSESFYSLAIISQQKAISLMECSTSSALGGQLIWHSGVLIHHKTIKDTETQIQTTVTTDDGRGIVRPGVTFTPCVGVDIMTSIKD